MTPPRDAASGDAEQRRKVESMEKNKKKAVSGAPKSAKRQSEYKSRETESKSNQTDAAFKKAFGKAKDVSRKG